MRTFIFTALQGLIIFIISIYVESISNGRVLVIGDLLSASASKSILNHPVRIIGFLGMINASLMVIASITGKKRAERLVYDKLCKYIFDVHIRNNSHFEKSDCKVSLLKLHEPWYNKKSRLHVTGRHQTKQGYYKSNVKFIKGEGCAGLAYETN